ncbi:MAG TPA: L-threonylcarbamoyladenylate synthase [Candidatus Saccharimonadales bacterium]|nr:L-threonylcarbamoyladenylate synthase [Candidatus Saccharimonadales bacterium]
MKKATLQDKIVPFDEALHILLRGGVGILPTDTVYGLATRADSPQGVARLYAIKHRERKPGTIIAASTEQLASLGVDKKYLRKVEQWWPNPLSVIVPTGQGLFYLHQGLDSLPMRIPQDETLRTFLGKTGPLATSSANQPGETESRNLEEAWAYFGNDVDFYVDGGDMSGRKPSTIIRINQGGDIEVLRNGAVKII